MQSVRNILEDQNASSSTTAAEVLGLLGHPEVMDEYRQPRSGRLEEFLQVCPRRLEMPSERVEHHAHAGPPKGRDDPFGNVRGKENGRTWRKIECFDQRDQGFAARREICRRSPFPRNEASAPRPAPQTRGVAYRVVHERLGPIGRRRPWGRNVSGAAKGVN